MSVTQPRPAGRRRQASARQQQRVLALVYQLHLSIAAVEATSRAAMASLETALDRTAAQPSTQARAAAGGRPLGSTKAAADEKLHNQRAALDSAVKRYLSEKRKPKKERKGTADICSEAGARHNCSPASLPLANSVRVRAARHENTGARLTNPDGARGPESILAPIYPTLRSLVLENASYGYALTTRRNYATRRTS